MSHQGVRRLVIPLDESTSLLMRRKWDSNPQAMNVDPISIKSIDKPSMLIV